jgi:hypothetical protein
MTWLFESPASIAALGGVALFFLMVAWVQTGQNAFLYGAGAALVLTVALLAAERYVVTDSEAVQARLYEIAAIVEANDPAALRGLIVQSQPQLRDQAEGEMRQHRFTAVAVGKIHHVEVNPKHQPPQVTIEFNATASGTFYGNIQRDGIQRWVRLVFWKEDDGQWRIASYAHDEPTRFMRRRDEPGAIPR